MSSTTLNWNDMNIGEYSFYSIFYVSLSNLISYPADLLTTRLQSDKYCSHKNIKLAKVASDLVRREGLKGSSF